MNLNNMIKKSIKESIIDYFYESKQTQIQKYGNEMVNRLLYLDPTKTYKYIEQICKYYKENIPEDEIKKYIYLYNTKLTKHLVPSEYNDITKINTFRDLKDIVDNLSVETSHTEVKNNLMKESYLDAIKTDKGTFEVYRPYNTLQQIQLGKNTKWCISQIKDNNLFNKYFINDNVRFYIFIKDNDTKYQLNIYSNNKKEVWNSKDAEIGCSEFKELTGINCKNYIYYPINEYVKDLIIYDQYEHKIGHIINGKKEGEWVTYYDKDQIESITHYKENRLNGEDILYYENGNIELKQYYKDDKLDGESIEYYENGPIHTKLHYKDGKLDGERISYYKNGQIKHKLHYDNDRINGKKIAYYENGNIESVENYKNDKLEGENITYYESGEIKIKANYSNDNLYGEYNEYYKNGKIKYHAYFNKGSLYGNVTHYDENGKEVEGEYNE